MLFLYSDECSYNQSYSAGKDFMAGRLPKAEWLQKTNSVKNDGIDIQNALRMKICQNVACMSRSEVRKQGSEIRGQ